MALLGFAHFIGTPSTVLCRGSSQPLYTRKQANEDISLGSAKSSKLMVGSQIGRHGTLSIEQSYNLSRYSLSHDAQSSCPPF